MIKKQPPDEIASALFAAFTKLKTRWSFKGPFYELPLAQIETLRFIHEKQQVSMKEIAEFLAITPPSATVLINNLVKAGYVHRLADKKDRRTIHLSVSKKGSQVLQKGIKQRCIELEKLLNNISKSDQLELLNILKRMTN